MKTPQGPQDRRAGAALFTIVLIILVVGTLLAATCRESLQRVFMATKLADRVRALAIAEAGANYAYSTLRTNFAARLSTNEFATTSYGGGRYDITVTPVSNTIAVVRSVGTYGSVSEEVIVDVRNYGSSNASMIDSNALRYAILCGGNFDFVGCGWYTSGVDRAMLHANGTVTIRGTANANLDIRSSAGMRLLNNITIIGRTWAPTYNYNPAKVTITDGAFTGAVSQVTIPNIDLTPYYNRAAANSQVYNGDVTLSSGATPAGGVMWVNGRLTLGGNANYTGTFISTGDMFVPGSGAINNTNAFPTLVSRDGDINFTGQKSVSGLIYVKTGDFRQTGGNTLTGQLIVNGDIEKGGNSDVIVYTSTLLTPPDGSGSAADIIGVSAWQK